MTETPRAAASSATYPLVLIGPPGAGKTTVGRLVAQRWGRDFVDTDELVEREQGMSVAEIFLEFGEEHFRRLEAQAVADALDRSAQDRAGMVIAVGGGAPMTEASAARLESVPVVFLSVAIADAAGRIGFSGARPLLAVNPRATWTRLMEHRRPAYERLATWVVDTAGRTPREVADEIVAAGEPSDA